MTMKVLIELWALSSKQTQRKHLKVIYNRIIGTWKARNMKALQPMKY